MVNLYVLILAPLVGFLINGLMGKSLPKSVSGIISSLAVFVSFVISSIYFFGFVGGSQAPQLMHSSVIIIAIFYLL